MSLASEIVLENDKDQILTTVRRMIKACEPIKISDFNKVFKEKNKGDLLALEKELPKVGLCALNETSFAISTLSIIATITDIAVGERLAFYVDEGFIVDVEWYG